MKGFMFIESINVLIINTTPHSIRFQLDGQDLVVENNPELLLNAKAVEQVVGDGLVTTVFQDTPEGCALLDQIEKLATQEYPGAKVRIVGSIIAAQAYPERVVGMTPAPGYERVAPAEKRMNPAKFTVFMK